MAILKGKLPEDWKKNGEYEVYQAGKYLAVTGHVLDGFPRTIESRQAELDAFMQTTPETPVMAPEQEAKPSPSKLEGDWRERLEMAKMSKIQARDQSTVLLH